MKKGKRGIALLLCLLLCLGVLPGTAWGEESEENNEKNDEIDYLTSQYVEELNNEPWTSSDNLLGDVNSPDLRIRYASLILSKSNIVLAKKHPSGVVDNAFAYNNIVDSSAGKPASRSNYGNAPGGTVFLDIDLLKCLLDLEDHFGKVTVSEIAGASHSVNSLHYKGLAMDLTYVGTSISVSKGREIYNYLLSKGYQLKTAKNASEFGVYEDASHYHIALDKSPSSPFLTINITHAPSGTLDYGKGYSLEGTVSSSTPLSKVYGYVGTAEGQPLAGFQYTKTYAQSDNVYSYNIKTGGLDSAIKFGQLSPGNYVYQVTAANYGGMQAASQCYVFSISGTIPVTGVTLNKTSLTLNKSAEETLTATVEPSNATNKGVTWSSSNNGVATVDSNGKVTAVGGGSATITVKTNDGGKTATCAVTVEEKYYLDLNVNLNGENIHYLSGAGTADVYVNGALQGDNVTDYYEQWPVGTSYEITDLHANDGYLYLGCTTEGTLAGTIQGDTNVCPAFVSSVDIGTDFYAFIRPANTDKYLTVEADDYNVASRAWAGTDRQAWYFERLDDGSYKIRSLYNDKCLDVLDEKPDAGTNVGVCPDYNNRAQQWYFFRSGDSYQLRAKCTDCVLDFYNADEGANAYMWGNWQGWCQKFEIQKAGALDLNWILDGQMVWDPQSYGTADVYINGALVADDWTDYFVAWPEGSSYEITDVKPTAGHVFGGVASGALTGTLGTGRTEVWLSFNTASTFTITYDANGGTDAPAAQTKTQDVTLTLSSTVPTRSGYTFLGWAESKTATAAQYQPGGSFTKNANVTLYAVWKANTYTVTLDPTGGTVSPTQITVTYGGLYGEIPFPGTTPALQGYFFSGWYTEPNGGVQVHENKIVSIAANHTIYAHWAGGWYQVYYDANGGTGAPEKQNKTHGEPLTLSTTVPTRTGYTFKGWAESSDATQAQYQPGDIYTKDAHTTLYAVWKIKTYTVKYDANGGTGAPAKQTKTYGKTLTLSSTVPIRSGYTFLGWAESSDATEAQYQPGGQYTKNASKTLYAVWKAAPAANAATISVGSATGQAGTTVNVPISLKNNPGIISMMLQVHYDNSALTLIGCTDSGKLGTAYHNQDYSTMPYILSWGDDTATANNTYNGEIAVLHFQIKEGTADGKYPVSVNYSLDEMDIYNSNFEPVSFATVSGSVTASAVRLGDVNGDQKINGMDRTFLARHVAKWNGYGQSDIVYAAADVNADEKVNGMDRTILARHIAKWNGYENLPYHPAGGNGAAQATAPDAVLLEASGDPGIRVSSAEAMPGENVDVTVSLENNPGLISMLLSVEYDDSVLTLTGCTDAGKLGTPYHSPSFGTPYTLSWGDDTATSDNTYSGVIVTLHFTVHPDAAPGTYPITVSYDEDEPDIYNSGFESIHFELLPGTVAVGGGTPVHTHTLTHVSAADPSCTEPGNIEYWYCTECGKYFSDETGENEITQEASVVPALGHDYAGEVTEPTCMENGYTTYTCTRCGDSYVADEVPALGHDFGGWTETKAPTCTEPGEETRTCKRDGTHKETREIPPTGHSPGEAVRENEVPATCTESGSYDAVIYCTVCGAELSRETVTVPALGHDWGEWTETKAPTETEEGEETRSCKRCEATETRTIPPLVHQCEYTHVPAVEPSCTEPGNIEHWRCPICGKYYVGDKYDLHLATEDEVLLPALGHDWGDWTETQAPSCTEPGEETRTCKRDGTHKETREIPPMGHAPGEAVHENEVPATCTEAGSYDEVVYCTACGAELSRDSKTVPALGHDWSDWTTTTEATCTEAGEESRSCKRCDETETRATSPLGHDWGAWTVTKEPTETEPGEESRVCARCGATETRVMTEPEDHDWGDWKLTTKPGCTRSGQETRVCAHCGETETRPVEALGHRWGEWAVTKQPTATETGTETLRCLRCGRTMTRTVPCLTMPFTDVPEDAWYYEAVNKVWAQGLMTGVSDTLFAPGQSCERGMIVTILYRLAGAPEAGTSGFLDVPEGDYYAAAVAWAEAEGIVYGYDETHFFPRTPITRQQLAAMLYRYAAWAGLDVSAADGLTDYADAEAVSGYALEAMRWAVAQELLFGTEAQRLEPDAEATRVQTAAALARFTELAD